MTGTVIGILGLALCMILCGTGSAIGLYMAGSAASGVIGEDGKKFSKVFVLAVLPATQGIYGFVISIIGITNVAAIASLPVAEQLSAGINVLMATLPMTIVGFISAFFQGRTSVAAINAVAKDDSVSGKMILFPAMVETYAILALVITIMLLGI